MPMTNCMVIKIGSATLLGPDRRIDRSYIGDIARQSERVRQNGGRPVIVTSGAIAAGMERLRMTSRPRSLPEKQACASIGQAELMGIYSAKFSDLDLVVGQVLLTGDDLHTRIRYLHARNTLFELLNKGVVPIINENDTVAVDEIRIGENDTLSALVASAIGARKLLILTNVDGLLDPLKRLVPRVEAVTAEVEAMAGEPSDRFGTGGMRTKLSAARVATHSGVEVILARGRRPDVIVDAWNGTATGTIFPPQARVSSWKHWVAFGRLPRGAVVVNARAVPPLTRQGKSLLPVGITAVEGSFDAGDLIGVRGPEGEELARGLSNYSAEDVVQIMGRHTRDIAAILGHKDFDEVIHRDNMWVDSVWSREDSPTGEFRRFSREGSEDSCWPAERPIDGDPNGADRARSDANESRSVP